VGCHVASWAPLARVTTTALLSSTGVAAAVADKARFLFCPVLSGGGDDVGDDRSESVLRPGEQAGTGTRMGGKEANGDALGQ
jgi:hypothetical protein